jgi:hypothetical protein
MNENCWILQGKIERDLWWGKLLYQGEGTPVNVEFDYNKVYEIEDRDKSVIGFCHTHPGFTATPSMRDHATMNAWVQCLGKSLICIIHGVDGTRAFLYSKNVPLECERVERLGSTILVGLSFFAEYGNKNENDNAEIGGLGQPAKKEVPKFPQFGDLDLYDVEDDGDIISSRLTVETDDLECPQGHGLVKASQGYRCQKCGWNAILFP